MRRLRRVILPLVLALVLMAATAGGAWVWYDNNVDRSGWVEENGVRFYRDFHAHPLSGWLELPEGRYFLSESGVPRTGWLTIAGNRYHFENSGILTTGWMQTPEGTYHFAPDGLLTTGWMDKDGGRYFFDENGIQVTGWLDRPEGRYYLPQGQPVYGWQEIDGYTYYFDGSGLMVTGEIELDGRLFQFQADGILTHGWKDTENGRAYYLTNGMPAEGWQDIDGQRYFFLEEGLPRVGWMDQGEYRYYFCEDGHAAVGPADIDGQRHYFAPRGQELILVNGKNPLPPGYDPELIDINEWHRVAAPCYDALMQMLSDCEAAGIEYELNSSYRTQERQEAILEDYTEEYMQARELTFEEAREQVLEFVAIPGTSEHQLGLAVDLVGDEAVAWFNEHCWDYGFIRRYTAEKEQITGIIDEPWHFRYVGREIALDLKENGLCLEEYLGAEPVKG
ncbi:MAG: D-alanyl-D-alanine carboxypeptidase family protein [Eubacteriales bacterium]|nr:D-alanyl-D-alanine carboxypeptidase family protein [Eubacteriales bacterium]